MDEIESQDVVTEEPTEEAEATEEEAKTTEEPKEQPKETLEQKRARLQRELKQTEKKLGVVQEEKNIDKPSEGLDDTQLDYLDLKGITEQEDIDVIQNVMQRTGQSLREVLKDDYVASKLKANAEARKVSDATPSSTRRGAGEGVNLDALIAKAERTGELPSDFTLKTKVINALVERSNPRKPSWNH